MKNFLAIYLGAPGSPKFAEFMAMEEGKRKRSMRRASRHGETG